MAGVNARLRDLLQAVGELQSYARAMKVKRVIHCGDVFHLKKNIPVQAFDLLEESLRLSGLEWTFIAGNHDRDTDREDAVTTLPFKSFARVITEPEADRKERIIYLPWLYDQERIRQYLTNLKGEWDYLFFHGEINGGEVGPMEYQLKSKMTHKALKIERFEAVYAGHLHIRQRVGGVTYPGSIIAKDWGEHQWDKGFIHVTEMRKQKVIITTYPKYVQGLYEDLKSSDALRGNFVRMFTETMLDEAEIKRILDTYRPRTLEIKPMKGRKTSVARLTRGGQTMKDILDEYIEMNVSAELREKYRDYGRRVLS